MTLDKYIRSEPILGILQNQETLDFYYSVLFNFNFNIIKPIVFLPCSKQKPISHSLTHCYMGAITRDERFEKIIISDDQTVIPYSMESNCPNYDCHPRTISNDQSNELKRRLGNFLQNLYDSNPTRKFIYYLGARHHLNLLNAANKKNYFCIVSMVPSRGIRDYAKAAIEFKQIIEELEDLA